MNSILEKSFEITSADVDFSRSLTFSSLTNFLIQAAWKHADILGFGMDFLFENKLVWVLSRLEMEVYERPSWNKKIKVVTWPKGINRLFYLRDMEVYADGCCIAKATTQWLIIDMVTKRPRLYNPQHNIFNENTDKHALNNIDISVIIPETDFQTFQFEPRYSDIDLNQHLTTTSYVDWMFDTFTPEDIRNLTFKKLTLNFLKEIRFDDKVVVDRYSIPGENAVHYHFYSVNKGVSFFKGRLA